MKFFFRVCAYNLFFFRPPTFCRNFFFCVDGVEKVGIPLLLLATLAAVLFNSNRGLILAFVQFNSTAEQMRSAANVPNNPFVMHSHLTLSCLLHLHMYRVFTYICKLLNSLIFIKGTLSPIFSITLKSRKSYSC